MHHLITFSKIIIRTIYKPSYSLINRRNLLIRTVVRWVADVLVLDICYNYMWVCAIFIKYEIILLQLQNAKNKIFEFFSKFWKNNFWQSNFFSLKTCFYAFQMILRIWAKIFFLIFWRFFLNFGSSCRPGGTSTGHVLVVGGSLLIK